MHTILIGDENLISMVQGWKLLPAFYQVTVATIETFPQMLTVQLPEKTVIVMLNTFLDVSCLKWLNDLCKQFSLPWVQFHLDQGSGWLGPIVIPGATADYNDLLVRRLTVADHPDIHESMIATPLYIKASYSLLPNREWFWLLSIFFTEITRWQSGLGSCLVSTEVEANPRTLSLAQYPILPLPDHVLSDELQISTSEKESMLINGRSGIIIRTVEASHHPATPTSLKTVQTHVSFMEWHYPNWYTDPVCGGSTFNNLQGARQAAIGEAVERYCGNASQCATTVKASYYELIDAGHYAIDPEELVLFSDNIYQTPGCPFVPFTRDLSVYWVKGWSLTYDKPAWLPFRLVFVKGDQGAFANQPLTNPIYVPGIAAGKGLNHAIVSGIEELIERDSTMIWWLNKQPLPKVQLTPELEAIWDGKPTQMGQRAWLLHLPNEFNIPVMAGVVENKVDQLLNIGFACRPDAIQAGLKAWTEALILQEGSRDLLNMGGSNYQAASDGWIPDVYKPWRQDRSYLDAYRQDFRDVIHLLNQQQLFLDPRVIEKVRPWIDIQTQQSMSEIDCLPNRTLSTYKQRIESKGYEIFYVDITTPDIMHTDFKVVRVVIPGLVPNFPAAFPPTGKHKIQNMAVQLGWRSHPLPEEELNYMPMPHA